MESGVSMGEKRQVVFRVPGGGSVRGTVIQGCREGRSLIVTAGMHGCEYIGILAAKRLERELEPERLNGKLLILPMLNPPGFYGGYKQIHPADGRNLNREFPGREDGSYTQRLAWTIETEIYPQADFIVDLHGGDCHEALHPLVFFPANAGKEIGDRCRRAAASLSVPVRVASSARNGLYSFAAQRGIPGLLMERGCRGTWTEEDVEKTVRDLYRLMIHLEMLAEEEKEEKEEQEQREIVSAVYEETETEGFWHPYVSEGESVLEGQLLGKLYDEQGGILKEYRARFDGMILYYTVALGVRAGEPLVAYGR